MSRYLVLIVCLGFLTGCGALGLGKERAGDVEALRLPEPETQLDYEAEVVGAPSEEIEELMEDSLAVFRRAEDGAQSLAFLRRRAEGDVETAVRILKTFGHYDATATAEVERLADAPAAAPGRDVGQRELGAADPVGEAEPAPPTRPRALARIRLEPGPVYTLARHRFRIVGDPPGAPPELPEAAALGSPVGAAAAAAGILAAEREMVKRLRALGRPWAEVRGRRAVADPEARTLTVTSRLAPGPEAVWGGAAYEGLEQVERAHVETYRPWEAGDMVIAPRMGEFQRRLAGTDLFSAVSVALPEDPPPAGADGVAVAEPVVLLGEGPRRSVSAGLRADTDRGPLVRGSFLHRNIFGSGERFRAAAELGLLERRLELGLTLPQWPRRHAQDLGFGLELRSEEGEAYDESAATLTAGLERRLDARWTIGGGGLLEISEINGRGARDVTSELAGLPLYVAYDDTEDPLDRTDGQRGRLTVTPFTGLVDETASSFLVLDANAAVYRRVYAPQGVVLAGRVRAASVLSEGLADVPPQRRLYSGGDGSVRGYAEDFVGPLDAAQDPVGGRSALEVTAEVRADVWGDIGGVAFVDGGAVSRDMMPSLAGGPLWAAGVGLRYYSPVGPIRLDVAFPLNPRRVDDAFAAYFSIGQAF